MCRCLAFLFGLNLANLPKIQLMKLVIAVLLISIAVFSCKSKPPATAKEKTSSMSSLESGILAEVNKYRKSKGLGPLAANSVIETEAAMHSQAMASKRIAFGHDGYNTRISRISNRLGGVSASAENVAYGNMSAKEVVQSWLKSAAHRKNIEGRYNLTGIGVSRDNRGVVFYTQLFALKS